MIDKPDSPEKEEGAEGDNHTGEKPILTEKGEPNSNAQNAQKYANYAHKYFKIAYEWITARALPRINKIIHSSNFWTAAATVVIAATTISYNGYARRQWRAMLDSNEISRDSLQSVQRAYISFQQIQTTPIIERTASGETIGLQFSAQTMNTGNTPGNGGALCFFGDSLPNEPTEEQFIGSRPLPVSKVIGPKALYFFGDIRKSGSFWGLDRARTTGAVQTHIGKHNFVLWGWVTYRDVFPQTNVHVTEFCQRLVTIGVNPERPSNARPEFTFRFQDCEHHNCADEQCEDYKAIIAAATKRPN